MGSILGATRIGFSLIGNAVKRDRFASGPLGNAKIAFQRKSPACAAGLSNRGVVQKELVAASDSADTPIIPLDGHSPAAATPLPSVVSVASMIPVVRPTDINSEATPFKVHTLSQSGRRCRSSHCAEQSERDQ
jgi:hypothetical protein